VVSFSKHIQLDYKERTWGASGLLLTSLIRSKVQFIHQRNKIEPEQGKQARLLHDTKASRWIQLKIFHFPRHLFSSSFSVD
jgi:hypothetical protein